MEHDATKNAKNLRKHALDLADAATIFDGECFTREDRSMVYPEQRFNTVGIVNGEIINVTWTPDPDEDRPRAISMRPATPAQKAEYVRTLQGRY